VELEETLSACDETPDHPRHAALSFQKQTGWIVGSWPSPKETPILLCWLPIERRGSYHAVFASTVVVSADTGAITILDFSTVLAMLDDTEGQSM
jgi:hypothetical protein